MKASRNPDGGINHARLVFGTKHTGRNTYKLANNLIFLLISHFFQPYG